LARQYFSEVLEPIMPADQTAVTGTSEAGLWPTTFTSLAANDLKAEKVIRITAWGLMTTAASSPGTLTITPRYGTSTGGTTLGISAASATLTTSQTNVAWYLTATATCRTVGSSGTMVLGGIIVCNAAFAAPLAFGGTTATVDTTAASGIFIGVTLGSASDSMTTKGVAFETLN